MASRIVYTDPAGNVCVITPAPQFDTPELLDWVATETLAKAGLPPTPYEIVEHTELPSRRFRGAWKSDGKTVAVDLDAAKKIRVAELEREAAILTEAAAKEHMIATAKGDNATATAARQKVQALASLDKASIEAAVADVADLDALAKHEPAAIKDAKPTKPR